MNPDYFGVQAVEPQAEFIGRLDDEGNAKLCDT
jgi:hypothetical protein